MKGIQRKSILMKKCLCMEIERTESIQMKSIQMERIRTENSIE